MSVLLRRSVDLPSPTEFDNQAVIGNVDAKLEESRACATPSTDLERAFEDCEQTWLSLAHRLGAEPSAGIAHTPACTANLSDFGLMLAWTRLVEKWARADGTTLVVCDDPWLFRHLRGRKGVKAGAPPNLLWARVRLSVRGVAARTSCALRMGLTGLALRGHRTNYPGRGAHLLVYGHPASEAGGRDGYFGDLMCRFSRLRRVLHVDCPRTRAGELASSGKTFSLHGWGSLSKAPGLIIARWRPAKVHLNGPNGWLVRRAAAREGGTAQGAMIRWQIICQKNWLERVRPDVVAWPWENHAWERAFVRDARALGVKTVGYQHSVIGPQMLNYAPASNPDGLASIPDRILCAGRATRDQLARWGIPDDRLAIAGALRFTKAPRPTYDKSAPVFMALPSNSDVAGEMVKAAIHAGRAGWRFVVKPHPMMPFSFTENDIVRSTDRPLSGQKKVSAVVYAGTTVGLEAMVAGIPTLRFQPRNTIALNILPRGVAVPTADSAALADVLDRLAKPPQVDRHFFFAPVDLDLWRDHLFAD